MCIFGHQKQEHSYLTWGAGTGKIQMNTWLLHNLVELVHSLYWRLVGTHECNNVGENYGSHLLCGEVI